MTVLGMPLSMFLVFAATVLAGSLGAIHYVIVHMILKRPFADEGHALEVRTASGRVSGERGGGAGGTRKTGDAGAGPDSGKGADHHG